MTETLALRRHHGRSARTGHAKARMPGVRGRSFPVFSYPWSCGSRGGEWSCHASAEAERVVTLRVGRDRITSADRPPVGLEPGDGSPRFSRAGGRPAGSNGSSLVFERLWEDWARHSRRVRHAPAVLLKTAKARRTWQG